MIETARLQLLPPSPDLAEPALDYYNRNRAFLAPWSPSQDNQFFTLDHMREMMFGGMDRQRRQEEIRYWIRRTGQEGLIGQFCFSQIIRGPFQSCFLGYSLDSECLNCGYMTEALEMGISLIFSELSLHRIEANIMPRNIASLRVVEKLGFYREGRARDYLKINGCWEDHIHMVLLNPEV